MEEKALEKDIQGGAKDETTSSIRIFRALVVVALGILVGYFVVSTTLNENSRFPFKLGLDLAGGSHLVYSADVENVAEGEVDEAMGVLRDVIERRVNIFGVSEPIVQVEQTSIVSGEVNQRLVVELPGVTDINEAVAAIGETPLLEFKLFQRNAEITQPFVLGNDAPQISQEELRERAREAQYADTGLTGRYLERANLVFGQSSGGGISNEPIVQVTFNSEGADLFEAITRANVGEQLAIFLDGEIVSQPVINEPIAGGIAVISGGFTADTARELVRNLNFGALPVPIQLESTQTIGPALGAEVLEKGVYAGMIGIILVMIFMVAWYRIPGVIASIALCFFLVSMLALFKVIPVTLTAAGLAGLILALGMAVDANVLVFERMKEEYLKGADSRTAARTGFKRAWSAIRDSNITSILSAVILFWFGTSIVKGFALVFGMGILLSMFSAIVVTRTLLVTCPPVKKDEGVYGTLFTSGFSFRKTDKN